RCWWVRSALTYSVNAIEATNANIRVALTMIASGQLLILGVCRTWKSPAANRPQRPIFHRVFAQ
ncbi:MAG TPA: hypothetical protein PLG70_08640, partial [Ottowia sp.]|nr:hypothetical protein [Ottowia sp.]